ncbi:MAP7 domain-containing protein 1 [Frankliniella occidentalis]|uniref:MAP7 domain-containing protein 1 n=1 Tax=Frankliniella occidentalis TaxID=133901 RepID=A0A9C6X0C2_FRAOC|nr:MAP7 domain-containing protein 1 [Frankliniella occidentalis]
MLARVAACTAAVAGTLARLDSARCLLMLLGVQERELAPETRALLGGDCRRMAVRDQDASFVGEFLAEAMDILVRAWRSRTAKERRVADGGAGALFSLAPKKVKVGASKVLALLANPLQPGDDAQVLVRKGGDPVAVATRTRNPYTLQFTVPDSMLDVSAMVTVVVTVNGQSLGSRQLKCESRLRELDRTLRAHDNPVQFLCQTLGFGPGDLEALDSSLLCSYMRNVPPHFNLLQSQGGRPSYSCETYPTLLHFAAHLGLERLAMALLEGPGGEQACYIRNSDDLTPAEMSERAGHQRLACTLQGYMQMSELSSVYTILKTISEGAPAEAAGFYPAGESANYLSPRPAGETYSVPPPPAPVPAPGAHPQQAPPPPPAQADPYVDMISLRGHSDVGSLYQNMPAPAGRSQSGSPPGSPRPAPEARRHSAPEDAVLQALAEAPQAAPDTIPEYCPEDTSAVYQDIDETDGPTPPAASAAPPRRRRDSDPALASLGDEDDDILGIIHDLKSSSFSLGALGEVEHLVESWRGRNATHQSLRDKQEQLARMREELQRVEHRLGGEARPSPFERIKRVFSRARHGRSSKARAGPAAQPAPPARPASSLSRRSSSSSTWSDRSTEPAEHPDVPESPMQVEEVSWLHPVSPASDEHYVVPHGVRPVPVVAAQSPYGAPPAGPRGGTPATLGTLDLADDGFPLDSTGFCSYVNVNLPSCPPPVPARPQVDLPLSSSSPE